MWYRTDKGRIQQEQTGIRGNPAKNVRDYFIRVASGLDMHIALQFLTNAENEENGMTKIPFIASLLGARDN